MPTVAIPDAKQSAAIRWDRDRRTLPRRLGPAMTSALHTARRCHVARLARSYVRMMSSLVNSTELLQRAGVAMQQAARLPTVLVVGDLHKQTPTRQVDAR